MTRAADPSIPEDERLFRGLLDEHVDGDTVLDDAVDLRGTSCDREPYLVDGTPRSDQWKRFAWVTPSNLPGEVTLQGQQVAWEFFAVDDPFDGNEAHCEIRVRRTTHRHLQANDDAIRGKSAATKALLKNALATRFRVLPLGEESSGQ